MLNPFRPIPGKYYALIMAMILQLHYHTNNSFIGTSFARGNSWHWECIRRAVIFSYIKAF